MQTITYTVTKKEAGLSLLAVLSKRLKLSNKKTKELIDSRTVFVNQRRIWMAKHSMKYKDVIETASPETSAPSKQKPKVLFEDEHYLIVNKLPGTLSNGENSTETVLKKALNLPKLTSVHRLDKDTSGCLILAKSKPAFNKMIPIFRQHKIEKTYHAIAVGKVFPPIQTIKEELDGKTALTSIKTLDSNKHASHLMIKIRTGRTHQIRKHLALSRNFIIGDKKYGVGYKADKYSVKVSRQMLHASNVHFTHPFTNKEIRIRASLPYDFSKCLKAYNLG